MRSAEERLERFVDGGHATDVQGKFLTSDVAALRNDRAPEAERGRLLQPEGGLTGEVRAVTGLDIRLKEAAALGFRRSVGPKSSVVAGEKFALGGRGVATVNEALEALLG